jgi:hypothetical protein
MRPWRGSGRRVVGNPETEMPGHLAKDLVPVEKLFRAKIAKRKLRQDAL